MYSVVKTNNLYYYITASGNCMHEVATMYKDMPEKVSKYNDKLMIKLLNPYNFPLKQWQDYYLTINDDCIMMYFTPGQYVAPYYKNEIMPVAPEIWRKMYKSAIIPPLTEEPEEPIPIFKTYEEYVSPPPSDDEPEPEELEYISEPDDELLEEIY